MPRVVHPLRIAVAAVVLAAVGLTGLGTVDRAPAAGPGTAAAKKRVIGCRPSGSRYRESGSRRHRVVALTFDGGPTDRYTGPVLARLREAHVHVTFFIRGQFIDGRRARLRQELREGHELANHSYSHPYYPSTHELWRTNHLIHGATGYTPCLFRAPYGAVNGALLDRARHLGMLTIGWDVDSWDSLYDNLSASTIYKRVVHGVRPGSIILMHDGEGSHPGTLRALAPILRNLKRRHFKVVPVSPPLHLRARTA